MLLLVLFSKQTSKKAVVSDDEDDDDEVLELKDRLAAYNLESSPDKPAGMYIFP